MTKYKCNVCNVYEYDSEKGDAALQVAAGTLPEPALRPYVRVGN